MSCNAMDSPILGGNKWAQNHHYILDKLKLEKLYHASFIIVPHCIGPY